jgi:hypothetical protein
MKRSREAQAQAQAQEIEEEEQEQQQEEVSSGSDVDSGPPTCKSAKWQGQSGESLAKKRGPTFASKREEVDVVEWLIGQPAIYDRDHRGHQNGTVVAELWAEKAAELGVHPHVLKTWYRSCRSQYGKVIKEQSKTRMRKVLTKRDQWILQHFDFIKSHITPKAGPSTSTGGC